ncbi:MAG: sodium-dependent transporter [Bacteroidales bacterium]|nr:sodium-dependent transporter [Bacteroidales bacterium]
MPAPNRENFGSTFTFIMATAGSAIGLGNIWRFPFMAGEYGGGAFIVAYVICSLFLALPCFLCESLIGRRARHGVYGAFKQLAPGSKWKYMGALTVFSSFILVSFYAVVGGWSLDFLFRAVCGGLTSGGTEGALSVFPRMASSPWESVLMGVAFLAMTAFIVLGGIKKGIERFTKIMIPLLFVLMLALVVFSVSLPGAGEGVRYLVKPDMSRLGPRGWAFALGQSFFSMSLGVGTILVYSSFMKKEHSLMKVGVWTTVSDTAFALIAGFAIMPAVFSAGIAPEAGPSLVYETLPYIFARMSEGAPVLGYLVTVAFFLAILMAALTSSISICEVCVEHAVEQFGSKRLVATMEFLVPTALLSVPCALSFGLLGNFKILGLTVFDFCDNLTSNYLMTLGALAFALFVGWKMKKADVREEFISGGSPGFSEKAFKVFYFLVRWVVPPVIIVIFISNLFLK